MKRLAFALALFGLIDLAGGDVAGQSRCTFPSDNQRCRSPRGLWEVEWQEPSGDGRDVLWLKPTPSGTRAKLMEFDRSVDLLWSPDGRALAVTDPAGSSESVVWVFNGREHQRRVKAEGRTPAMRG